MKLTSKEVQMVETLRKHTDGVFTVVKQHGDVRQVAKRSEKSLVALPEGTLFLNQAEGNHNRVTSVILLQAD